MKQNILIIEDEPSIADNISYVLETEGFNPVWKNTATSGKKSLKNENISLIILDIGLPDGNGFDLCKEIRKDTNVPIIFLTARSEEIDRILGLELGADDYVSKPFSPRELVARVKAVLRRQADPIGTSSLGTAKKAKLDFIVDDEKNRITYCGKILKLSRYEYKMLKLMIEHPGRVYTRKNLMNLVWEEPEVSMERTVDTHVKTIRSKLKEINPRMELIATHRGFGYSLVDMVQSPRPSA
ncbi:MAG TPA: two-component system response regulator CreB [Lentisphaeria bacterium]|nr:MAG: two-component system response regulator CreB [Lentisphaerae bacterium GWF2_49_21]HBC87527.1 two-component system response regulator CreB [Lentisphaeria bacterium]